MGGGMERVAFRSDHDQFTFVLFRVADGFGSALELVAMMRVWHVGIKADSIQGLAHSEDFLLIVREGTLGQQVYGNVFLGFRVQQVFIAIDVNGEP